MFHEILFALSGNCGGIFHDKGDGIQVFSDIPFISQSEVKILNECGKLGTHFRIFKNFIATYSSILSVQHGVLKSEDKLHGLYLKAACQGLNNVLMDYRQELLKLEEDFLHDPYLPVSHYLYHLKEFQLLFPEIALVIEQIKSHKAHGCYILDILHRASICGLPTVKHTFKRILHDCHKVLYKQLCAWLLHGTQLDSYNEFFIQKIDSESANLSLSRTTDTVDDDIGIMGITGRQMQRALDISTPYHMAPKEHLFGIQANLLPGYIPIRVASKILFVGESVQMFENEKQTSKSYSSEPILKNRIEEFNKDLHELCEREEFNLMAFEKIIDKIRTYVAEHLWVLIVEESDLRNQLKIIKDFFLLGRGELYLAFIDQAQHLLSSTATSTTQHDINMAFQQASRNVLMQDESLQTFTLTITLKGSSTDSSSAVESGWNCLGLQHSVQWPLHILFTPAMLERYDRVFRFLLAVKRAQLDIQSCWTVQMTRKEKPTQKEEMAKMQLRTHMGFLVDNLQYYLQVDVIESQYGILLDKINSTRDFEAVKVAHENFLSALLAQSFVHMKSVSHCLQEILDHCTAYCRLIHNSSTPLLPQQLQQLTDIAQKFQRQFNLLFKILSSVKNHNASPHLAQLLLRLDYNKYFTLTGGQIGL